MIRFPCRHPRYHSDSAFRCRDELHSAADSTKETTIRHSTSNHRSPSELSHAAGGRSRVAIFIDGSNLYHSLDENCKRFDVDFGAFAAKLAGDRTLFRTYYYNILRDPDRNPQAYQDQQKFLSALYSTPFLEVRLGTSKPRGNGAVEKGVDIMVAIDMLRFAWDDLYDVGILVSGDGDFAYALQSVKDLGKYVEVAAFPSNLAWELVQIADERELFTPEYFADLWGRRHGARRVMADQAAAKETVSAKRGGWQLGRFRGRGQSREQ